MSAPGDADPRGVGAKPLNLNSYYYSFDETGCRPVDELLAAVADAGHRSHHTSDWTERDTGPSPAEAIQQSADRLATALAASEADRAALGRRVAELTEVLTAIRDEGWVENCLDPQRPARAAARALTPGSSS